MAQKSAERFLRLETKMRRLGLENYFSGVPFSIGRKEAKEPALHPRLT